MKKSALVLAMMLALSLFTFVGCGNDGTNGGDMMDNGSVTEQNDGSIVDETEKGVDDMGNAAEDGVEDLADDAEDMVDGNGTQRNDAQKNDTQKNTDNAKSETKNTNQ